MKNLFTILCMLSIIVLVSACGDGDDEGSSGGAVQTVSYSAENDTAICYGADKNTTLGSIQICEWYCATFAHWKNPANWVLTFDMAPELTDEETKADYTVTASDPLPCK